MDVTDAGYSDRISWIHQITGWRLKWDYPGRSRLKKTVPSIYKVISQVNERSPQLELIKQIENVNPDVIHCFEMKFTGVPFQNIWNNINVPLIYSSWGSDIYDFKSLGLSSNQVQQFLNRVNYLITDCHRDYQLAQLLGFKGKFLGVFPGNGGINYLSNAIESIEDRNTIMIKGYDDGVGQAVRVLQAIERYDLELLKNYHLFIYSADTTVVNYIAQSDFLQQLETTIIKRVNFMANEHLMKRMGSSLIHIAISTSDGMPNALLEAMAMGAFPIQSNPGGVTEEVITHNENGLLINDPMDVMEIASHIKKALLDIELREKAQYINTQLIQSRYERTILKPVIQQIYLDLIKAI